MDHVSETNPKNSILEAKYVTSTPNVKEEKLEKLTSIMTARIKILDALKEKDKNINFNFPLNIVFYHKFQPLMKEINEYKTLCKNNPTPSNIALLKRAIDLSDHIMETKASIVDKVGYFVCKWLGLSEISDAEKLYNLEYNKLVINNRNKVDGLVLVYKRFHNTEGISDDNKAKLIESCNGVFRDVQDLVFVEKGKGQYTGTILYGVPESEGTIVLPNEFVYTGGWHNGKTFEDGMFLVPPTIDDEGAYIQRVRSENGELIEGEKIPCSPTQFTEEISRLGLIQKKEIADVPHIIVENSEEEINNDLNVIIDIDKSEKKIIKDLQEISNVNIKFERKLDSTDEITLLGGNTENNWPAGEIRKDEKLYGYAMIKYKNGNEAIGLFDHGILVDGRMSGKDGTKMSIVKESSIINQMLDKSKKFKVFKKGILNQFGEIVGQWEIQNKDGTKLRGNFYNGKLEGYGEIIDIKGKVINRGIYVSGNLITPVKLFDEKLYVGHFDERASGSGMMVDQKGKTYEGIFKDGKLL